MTVRVILQLTPPIIFDRDNNESVSSSENFSWRERWREGEIGGRVEKKEERERERRERAVANKNKTRCRGVTAWLLNTAQIHVHCNNTPITIHVKHVTHAQDTRTNTCIQSRHFTHTKNSIQHVYTMHMCHACEWICQCWMTSVVKILIEHSM